ncbi:MAG: hypothetical protein IPL50_01965 [Chitinophagaceae bacterium]|nr:hypothetical protein [Chitinophagaceae bacterium]
MPKNLIAFVTADDDFDFDFGYSGKIQFAIACRKPDFVDGGDAGNGIECDNDGSGTLATPRTKPQLSNFTIVGPNDAAGTAGNHNFSNRWRRATQFIIRNSILMGHPDAGLSIESDASLNDYFVNNISEFRNNLVHATALPYKTSNIAIATNALIQAKAEGQGCITYGTSAAIMLTSPFYSTAPNFLPATGSPALTGASFTGMNSFFGSTAYRGAIGTVDWTSSWTNWDPQTKVY